MQRSLSIRLVVPLAVTFLVGCGPEPEVLTPPPGDSGSPPFDAGRPSVDSGLPVMPDAGPTTPTPAWQAGEPCPEEAYGAPEADGGLPDGDVRFGVCVALRQLTGVATHNGQPAHGPAFLELQGASAFGSEHELHTDPDGRYTLRALRSRYEQVLFEVKVVHPSHQGAVELGMVDLKLDREKDVTLRSHAVSGQLSFDGAPWASLVNPPDFRLTALGIPPVQSVSGANNAGRYDVRLLQGQSVVLLSVPREALGGSLQINDYPVNNPFFLSQDTVLDVELPAAPLGGQLLLDGQAFPDRGPGPDFRLDLRLPLGGEAVVQTFHEGGGPATFAVKVPREVYSVYLNPVSARDTTYPSLLVGFQLHSRLDLTAAQPLDVNLTTHRVETALSFDHEPVPENPNYAAVFYAFSYGSNVQPNFTAYYEIPLELSSFTFRGFPGTYYLLLYLEDAMVEGLGRGWFLVDPTFALSSDRGLNLDIATSLVEGQLLLDGAPAQSNGSFAGTLTFSAATGSFQTRLAGPDGHFQVRLPRGDYELHFEVNPQAYPEYASGRHPLNQAVNAQGESAWVSLDYRTQRVTGPLLVAGERVPDELPYGSEVSLSFLRKRDQVRFTRRLQGGALHHSVRIPSGEYEVGFGIERGVWADVASGNAPLGGPLLVVP